MMQLQHIVQNWFCAMKIIVRVICFGSTSTSSFIVNAVCTWYCLSWELQLLLLVFGAGLHELYRCRIVDATSTKLLIVNMHFVSDVDRWKLHHLNGRFMNCCLNSIQDMTVSKCVLWNLVFVYCFCKQWSFITKLIASQSRAYAVCLKSRTFVVPPVGLFGNKRPSTPSCCVHGHHTWIA